MSALLARFHAAKAGTLPPAPVVATSHSYARRVNLRVKGCQVCGVSLVALPDRERVTVDHADGESTVNRKDAAQIVRRIRSAVRALMQTPEYGRTKHGDTSAAQADYERAKCAEIVTRDWFARNSGAPIGQRPKPETTADRAEHRYGLTLRPAGFPSAWGEWTLIERGTVGSYPLRTDIPEGKFPHGVVAFRFPLTDADVAHFDLTPLDAAETPPAPSQSDAHGWTLEPVEYQGGFRCQWHHSPCGRFHIADGGQGFELQEGRGIVHRLGTFATLAEAVAYADTRAALSDAINFDPAQSARVTVDQERRRIDLSFPDKPPASVREQLKDAGFRWHAKRAVWFHKDTPENRQFCANLAHPFSTLTTDFSSEPPPDSPVASAPPAAPSVNAKNAEQLRRKADALTDKIEHLTRPLSQNATPKRLRELASRTIDGERLRRVQTAFYALAEMWERGDVPQILASVRAVSQAEDLLRTSVDTSGGYYSCRDTGEFHDTTEQGRALQALTDDGKHHERKRARELQVKIDELRFCDIPGFFPTPPALARLVIERAEIDHSHRVLEPSAGIGSLAEACPNPGNVDCIEQWSSLADILSMKGYAVAPEDFMQTDPETWRTAYERIVMNPPFENGQDGEHVRHAWRFLKDGGRLVAIVGAGSFFRQDRKSTEFREWLDSVSADVEDIPEDAFKGAHVFRQTGSRCKLVTIDKTGGA